MTKEKQDEQKVWKVYLSADAQEYVESDEAKLDDGGHLTFTKSGEVVGQFADVVGYCLVQD